MDETNIDFDNIPTSLRKPGVYTEYNSRNAVSTLPTNEQNVLIVAPMLNATKHLAHRHRFIQMWMRKIHLVLGLGLT